MAGGGGIAYASHPEQQCGQNEHDIMFELRSTLSVFLLAVLAFSSSMTPGLRLAWSSGT